MSVTNASTLSPTHGSLDSATPSATAAAASPVLSFNHWACYYLGSIATMSAALASADLFCGYPQDDFASTVPFQLSRANLPGQFHRVCAAQGTSSC